MRVIVRKTHCRYCDDEFSTITVYPFALCVNGQTVISRNNGFMLTAPENYGIVTAAGKNLLPLKKSWLERPGK